MSAIRASHPGGNAAEMAAVFAERLQAMRDRVNRRCKALVKALGIPSDAEIRTWKSLGAE